MDSHIPELRTNRLLLRGFCGKDFADYQRMTADSEVMAHLGGVLAPPLSWRQMAMHNAASARVAERLDFGFDRRISVGTQEIDVYRRDRQRV